MTLEQLARDDGRMVRQYEYDDEEVLAIDFGARNGDASVDVADGTVIVVLGTDEQRELELPPGAENAQAFMKNGVLTIELAEEESR